MTEQTDPLSADAARQQSRDGLMSALIAYTCWGLLPIYFVFVRDVDSLELLVHRVIWAVPFGALIIHARRQWAEVKLALTHRKMLAYLSASATLIAVNWLVYIIAVQESQIFQASLGYYINPLMFALAGVFIFGEKLSTAQIIAIVLATIGVLVLTIPGGKFPTIAVLLGGLFAIYGVIRKKVVVGGMTGLFVEVLVLFPLGLAYLGWLLWSGTAVFSLSDPGKAGVLMLSGPFTVVPLLFFALAARRLNLSTVGMLQFMAPTLQFLVGVYYGEQLTLPHLICFAFIWTAVALFSWDALRKNRRANLIVTR
jgi:chloramphenicol-sensitive protein RarD